ncbi:MAG: hypothetical protein J0I09_02405 [Sphingobacteriia bacterium]|nr:hypothetical protein [Sphingobacteriia bacterium]
MKKIIAGLLAVTAILTACKEEKKEGETEKKDVAVTATSVTLPYKVNYSSDFEIGDSKYAKMVLDAWKDYDNGTLSNSAGVFGDSVAMHLADGSKINTKRDSAIAMVAAHRATLKSAVSSVDAVVVLKTKGKDDTWVCVWGKEVDEMKDGKKDSTILNENWLFNKDGKCVYIEQLMQMNPKPMKK